MEQNILEILNDDCLYETIKQTCIDINDLVQVALTCTRMEYIAKQVFRTKFKSDNHFEKMQVWTLEQLTTYLRLFGEFCRTFVIDWEQMQNITDVDAVLRLLTKYCKNLGSLKLFREDSMEYLRLVAINGLGNAVEPVLLPDLVDFSRVKFHSKLPLKVLKLHNCRTELPEQHFKHLQAVVLIRARLRQQNVDQFFKLNPQILRVKFAPDYLRLQSLGDAIKYLVNLEELTYLTGKAAYGYYDDDTNHECFEQLKKLRWLRIETSDRDTSSILNALHRISAPLESLNVVIFQRTIEVSVNLLINTICQFKLMKELVIIHFRSGMGDDFRGRHLIQVVNNMPQLEHISCASTNISFRDVYNMLTQPNQLKSIFFKIVASGPLAEQSAIELTVMAAQKQNIRAEIVVLYKNDTYISQARGVLSKFHSDNCKLYVDTTVEYAKKMYDTNYFSTGNFWNCRFFNQFKKLCTKTKQWNSRNETEQQL